MIGSSQQDFIDFYSSHADKVRGIIFRIAGESALKDLTQDTFLKAWESRHKFRGESLASTWLYRIAYNCAIDFLRKTKKSNQIESVLEELIDPQIDIQNRNMVEAAIKELSEEQRVVVLLHYVEDLSLREIAEILDVPEGTVKSRLSYARKLMNEVLSERSLSNAGR